MRCENHTTVHGLLRHILLYKEFLADIDLSEKTRFANRPLPPPPPPPQDRDCDVVSVRVRFAVVIAAAADCAKFTLKSEGDTAGMAVSMCVTLQRSAREVSAYACWGTTQISGLYQHSCQLLI